MHMCVKYLVQDYSLHDEAKDWDQKQNLTNISNNACYFCLYLFQHATTGILQEVWKKIQEDPQNNLQPDIGSGLEKVSDPKSKWVKIYISTTQNKHKMKWKVTQLFSTLISLIYLCIFYCSPTIYLFIWVLLLLSTLYRSYHYWVVLWAKETSIYRWSRFCTVPQNVNHQ